MANWSSLKAAIAEVIKNNGNQEITGQVLQNVLKTIVSNVGANATYAGIAKPSTNPGVPDGPVFYLATEPGIYSNFGIQSTNSLFIITNKTGNWKEETIYEDNASEFNLGNSNLFVYQGCFEPGIGLDINNNQGGNINNRLKTAVMRTQAVRIDFSTTLKYIIVYSDETLKIVKTDNFTLSSYLEIDTTYKYCRIIFGLNSNANIKPEDVNMYITPIKLFVSDINEKNISFQPFSETNGISYDKNSVVEKIREIADKHLFSYNIYGFRFKYNSNQIFTNELVYMGGGDTTNPDNWMNNITTKIFPFKTTSQNPILNTIREAVKELYVSGEKIPGLKILLVRNYGYNGATSSNFIIGTGNRTEGFTFIENINLGAVEQKGIKRHSQGRLSLIIDWDFIIGNYTNLDSDEYLLSDSVYELIANPILYSESIKPSKPGFIIVDINGSGDYTSLQDAIDNAGDSAQHPKTIIVLPGRYEMPEYNSSTRSKGNNRYLSIIGTDKINCVIENTVGYYITGSNYTDNSCLKLGGNCYIANLTIISSDEDYPSVVELDRHKAYCIHCDFSADANTTLEINNCRLINNHFSCIGFGLRGDYTLKIINTEMSSTMHENNGDAYATLYVHDGNYDGKQTLIVKNCTIINTNKTKSISIQNAYDKEIDLTFINNVCGHSGGVGYSSDSTYHKLSSISYGNNIEEMNYSS